jgi:hypothetical protein
MREVAGAEPVVDIDDGDAGGAGVEHGEERRQAAKVRPIAHAGRHSDHGRLDQPGHDAGQRALHARHDHQRARPEQQVALLQQTMKPGHADVVEALHPAPERPRRHRGLLGYGNIGRAGGDDQDIRSAGIGLRPLAAAQFQHPRRLMMDDLRKRRVQRAGLLRARPGREHHRAALSQPADNLDYLLRRFSLTENHLGIAGTELPVRVHAGKPQLLDRCPAQRRQRRIWRQLACLHPLQYLTDPVAFHSLRSSN